MKDHLPSTGGGDMYKAFLYCLLIVALICPAVYGQDFVANGFQHDPQIKGSETATLVDQDTGEKWVVGKGDEIKGWTVVEVTPDYVELLQYQSGEEYPILRRIYYKSTLSLVESDTAR
ncbi:MAG: hypothetical protein AB1724_12125 [Thermodesulfobacteriota bacterium]